jgi:4-amino-4-deoxy-L-arabinose transferase-like glycosyltransferase
VVLSLSTPIFEASDEIWHYPVVREIATNHRLPVQDVGVDRRWAQEGSQPPLYYALAALATGWIGTSDYEQVAVLNPFVKIGVPLTADNRNMVAHPPGNSLLQGGTTLAAILIRWLSVLLVAATAYLAFRLADAIYPSQPAVSLLTMAFVAFNPMVLFIAASVNNDNLLMLLSTLALWLMVRDVQSTLVGLRWRATLLLGVVIGLASLAKVSGLVLLPVAALGITVVAWRQRSWRMWQAKPLECLQLVRPLSQ